jgi:four helix bundle protein
MTKISSFRDLLVWQKSMEWAVRIYKITGTFPNEERYGLISQLRKSSSAIPSNIAEGFGRKTTKDYLRFLNIALASSYEALTQIELSFRVDFISITIFEEYFNEGEEIGKMLNGLISKLESKIPNNTTLTTNP